MIAPPSDSVQQSSAAAAAAGHQQAHSDGADSDSDWDDDDDFVVKKINIKIKPIAQLTPGKISASVDELRATVGTWKSMGNVNLTKPNSRRSVHQSTMLLHKMPLDTASVPPAIQAEFGSHDFMPPPLNQVPKAPLSPPALNQPPIFAPLASTPNGELETSPFDVGNLVPLMMPSGEAAPPTAPQSIAPLRQQQQQQQFVSQPPRKQPYQPVAFATQECLNVRTSMSPEGGISTSLVGHIKMALPRSIIEVDPDYFTNNELLVQLASSMRWSSVRVDNEFVRLLREEQDPSENHEFLKIMSLNMRAAYEFVRQRFNKQPGSNYFLLPELASYTIRSRDEPAKEGSAFYSPEQPFDDQIPPTGRRHISPIRVVTHWLCDLSVTKVRVDIEFLEDSVGELTSRIEPEDISNLKLSMQVNGNVVSQQSKPEATWSPIDSRLTWSFSSLRELIGANKVSSCLAKLTLADGPSTPSATSIQFAISGKTISGTRLDLLESHSSSGLAYKLARQKQEVRTGTFECEPPCQ